MGGRWRQGTKGTLGIRPQYLTPTSAASGMLRGEVLLTERLGSETVVDVSLGGGTNVIAALPEDKILESGETIGLSFDPTQTHLFAERA